MNRVCHVSLTIGEERLSVLLPTCVNLFNCHTSCLQTLTDNKPRVPCVTDDWRGETIRAINQLCKSHQLTHPTLTDNRPRVPCVTDDWRGETIRAITHLCKSLQLRTSCLQTLTDNRPRVPCVTDDWRGETIRAITHLCKSLQLSHILSADPD
ncbi:hypothetical protein J6590_030591 [Homalodisca vitripennis]|nr:hypothetical protein J6590_030591 [Homalodisca vitripennis]